MSATLGGEYTVLYFKNDTKYKKFGVLFSLCVCQCIYSFVFSENAGEEGYNPSKSTTLH